MYVTDLYMFSCHGTRCFKYDATKTESGVKQMAKCAVHKQSVCVFVYCMILVVLCFLG